MKLDKGIRPPTRVEDWGSRARWAVLQEMDAFDSFLIPDEDYHACRMAAYRLRKISTRRYALRREGDGWRVWRTA